MLNSSINCIACKHEKNTSSYLTLRDNGLFLFISFEDRGVHKSVFQDYFKTNQITGKGDYAKIFHGKY